MRALFHKNFSKNYKKLPERIHNAFKTRLKLFLQDPFHPLLNNHALSGKWQNFRSINVTGDMRAFYKSVSESVIEFVIIDTHSNLYS